jgi:hypothetical protein
MELEPLSTRDLLRLYAAILAELLHRGVIVLLDALASANVETRLGTHARDQRSCNVDDASYVFRCSDESCSDASFQTSKTATSRGFCG